MQRETGILKEYKLRFVHVITPDSQSIIYSDISDEITTMNNLLKDCIFIGSISFFCFLGISSLLAQWAIKPVDIAWKRQKQFIADASHELKTPLTVILTNAELLQTPGYDEVYKARFINNILLMSNQMKNLVGGLLELARVDNGITKSGMTTLNFSKLVENSIYPFEPLYFENNLLLTSQIQNDICIKGNDQYLHQVVEILLDNALKYATSNTKIFVKLQKHEFHCILSVSNYGEEIASKDLKNIFERFYKIDQSRTSKNSYGLGLSIAKSIISDHHGKIWCESSNGKNTFYVQLRICNCNE
jgi:signal transduction histidine kinase